jgi:hypothetical protein
MSVCSLRVSKLRMSTEVVMNEAEITKKKKKLQMAPPQLAECVRCRLPHLRILSRMGQYKFRVGLHCARFEADGDSGFVGYDTMWVLCRCTDINGIVSQKAGVIICVSWYRQWYVRRTTHCVKSDSFPTGTVKLFCLSFYFVAYHSKLATFWNKIISAISSMEVAFAVSSVEIKLRFPCLGIKGCRSLSCW